MFVHGVSIVLVEAGCAPQFTHTKHYCGLLENSRTLRGFMRTLVATMFPFSLGLVQVLPCYFMKAIFKQ